VAWPAIIFCRTRHGSDRLVKQLDRLGVQSVAIHGGLAQNQRNRALDAFASGRVHAMVATDVAARGIHVDGVESVVHYDPPEDHKAYVHRSGRTARAGANGIVLSLVQPEQLKDTRKLQREVGLDGEITAPDLRSLPINASATRTLAATTQVDRQPAPQPRRVNDERRPAGGRPAAKSGSRPAAGGRPNRSARRAHMQPGSSRGQRRG
jgi:superfamily II DNA/RNA helicase